MTLMHPGVGAALWPRRASVAIMTLLATLTTMTISAPALATEPSGQCANGAPPGGTEMQLLSGDFGLPLWLGIHIDPTEPDAPAAWLCYGTGAPEDGKIVGGSISTREADSNSTSYVAINSDENAAADIDATVYANRHRNQIDPGGADGGQAVTVRVPFKVCAGTCYPSVDNELGTTGVIIGQISQKPAPSGGASAAYSISSLCLYVNGIQVTSCAGVADAGATTTGAVPVNVGTGGGSCVAGVCVPVDYVGTSGAQLATLYIPEIGDIPVYGVHQCLYQKDSSTSCPA